MSNGLHILCSPLALTVPVGRTGMFYTLHCSHAQETKGCQIRGTRSAARVGLQKEVFPTFTRVAQEGASPQEPEPVAQPVTKEIRKTSPELLPIPQKESGLAFLLCSIAWALGSCYPLPPPWPLFRHFIRPSQRGIICASPALMGVSLDRRDKGHQALHFKSQII